MNAAVSGFGYLEALPDITTWIYMSMFDEYSVNVNENFNSDVLDRADEQFEPGAPVQIIAKWESGEDLDLNGLV